MRGWAAIMRAAFEVSTRKRSRRLAVAASLTMVVGSLSMVVQPASVAAAATDAVTNCSGSGSVHGSLPYVVAHAGSGDTVTFAPVPACTSIEVASPVTIAGHVTIQGPGAGSLAVSGGGSNGVFVVQRNATATISGLTVENGASAGGGAIVNNGTLTVTGAVLADNTASRGDGGAIYNQGAPEGAPATLTVSNTTFSGNSVTGGFAGGAIANFGSAIISGSTFSGNTSRDWAGAVANFGTSLTVSNSTFANNSATDYAGALLNWTSATITDATFSGNKSGFGGGIVNSFHGTLKLGTTIVANTTSGGDCSLAGSVSDLGFNLVDDDSCPLHAGTDLTGIAAGLDPAGLKNNGGPTQTIALQTGSAAVGRVSTASQCPATDQRGDPRTVPCDIGAYDTGGRNVDVTVKGSQSYGGRASFSQTNNAPAGVTLTGTLICTSVDGGTPISTTLGVGPHTVVGTSCSGLSPSNSAYHLVYQGSAGGYVVSKDATMTVLSTNAASQVYGHEGATTFTATVATGNGESIPSGETVTITVGSTGCLATLAPVAGGGRGGCSLGATALGVGPYTASVSYGGDSVLSGSGPATAAWSVTSPAPIVVTVTGAQSYGKGATFAETDNAPVGVNLTGTLACSSVDGGTAITATLVAGPHTVVGSSCSGLSASDPNYTLTYAGATDGYVVSTDTSSVHLATNSASQAYGQENATTFTASVATGNGEAIPVAESVTVEVGTTSCLVTLSPIAGGGRGGCSIGATDLDAGPYTASVSYGGDNDLSGSGAATTPFTVTRDSTTVSLATDAARQAYGQEGNTTFTATVTTGNGESLPSGETVTVDVGTTTCLVTLTPIAGGGRGTCSIGATDLEVGPYTASVTYGGDTDLSGSAPATKPFTVTPDSTAVTLGTNSASQAYGQENATTFTASVATGNGEAIPVAESLTVEVGTTTCLVTLTPTAGGGRGGCSIGATDLDVGPYTASVNYGGDNDLSGAGAATTPFTVTQDSTAVSLATNALSQTYGQESLTTFTATVTTGNGESLPSGETVTVTVGTTTCLISLTPIVGGGRGGCSIGETALGVGSYTGAVSYGGDTDLAGSGPATTPFTVTSPDTIVVAVVGSQTYGGAPTFSQTNNAPAGVTLTGTLVCSTVDGGLSLGTIGAGTHTVDGGTCSGLTSSDANYSLDYVGSVDGYVVSKDSATIALAKSTPFLSYGQEGATTFTATVTTGNGEPLPAGQTATVSVGTTSCVVTLVPINGGGQGGCSISPAALGVGPYTALTSFDGDSDLAGAGPAHTSVPVTKGSTDVTTFSCTVPGFGSANFPVVVSESPAPPSSIDAGGTLQTTLAAQVTVPASVINHYLAQGATSLTVSSQSTTEKGLTAAGLPSGAVNPDSQSASATNLPQTDPGFLAHSPYAFGTSYNPVSWQAGPGTGLVEFTPGGIGLVVTVVIHGQPTTASIGCSPPPGIAALDSTTVDPPPAVPTMQVPSPTPPLQSQVSPGTDGGWAVVIANTSTAAVTGIQAKTDVTDAGVPVTYDLTGMSASGTTGCTAAGPGALTCSVGFLAPGSSVTLDVLVNTSGLSTATAIVGTATVTSSNASTESAALSAINVVVVQNGVKAVAAPGIPLLSKNAKSRFKFKTTFTLTLPKQKIRVVKKPSLAGALDVVNPLVATTLIKPPPVAVTLETLAPSAEPALCPPSGSTKCEGDIVQAVGNFSKYTSAVNPIVVVIRFFYGKKVPAGKVYMLKSNGKKVVKLAACVKAVHGYNTPCIEGKERITGTAANDNLYAVDTVFFSGTDPAMGRR
jgi:fibronectin-binding autotransporter adhesin